MTFTEVRDYLEELLETRFSLYIFYIEERSLGPRYLPYTYYPRDEAQPFVDEFDWRTDWEGMAASSPNYWLVAQNGAIYLTPKHHSLPLARDLGIMVIADHQKNIQPQRERIQLLLGYNTTDKER